MTVTITPNDKGNPPGKLADAELHFTEGPLSGLKLVGFGVWERWSFALLRPISDEHSDEEIREAVLRAYADHEAQFVAAAG